MWKQISTVGLKDVVVEFEVKASGLSEYPHGMNYQGSPYKPDNARVTATQKDYLPYSRCATTGSEDIRNCIDCFMIEEGFEVWYTSDYNPPFNSSMFPTFYDPLGLPGGGINRWLLAKAIPREILRKRYSDWSRAKLDFSMMDKTDNNSNFGLWFRCQLDGGSDSIQVRNIIFRGKNAP